MSGTVDAPARKERFSLREACKEYDLSHTTLYRRVRAGEFTSGRDGDGQGWPHELRRDELDVYTGRNPQFPAGGLTALRKFRRIKGRAK